MINMWELSRRLLLYYTNSISKILCFGAERKIRWCVERGYHEGVIAFITFKLGQNPFQTQECVE